MTSETATYEFHVAPDGSDSAPGTPERPFATLQRAQAAVREQTDGMAADVVVHLHAGTHVLAEPLLLSSAAGDCGENGHRVIYQGFGARPEAVVVSGGRRIGGWELHDEERNVWRADAGDLVTRQLYVDGRRAMRARLRGGDAVALPGNVVQTEEGYVTDSTEPQSWVNPQDIELVYRGHSGFGEPRCGVAAISGDERSTTITMDQPCYRWFRQNHTGRWGDGPRGFGQKIEFAPPGPVWVENSLSFLTEPGTFYLDRSQAGAHVLYYIPRGGEDLARAEVVAPSLEQLVDGAGKPGAPLRDVTFRGLTFAYATWNGPDEPTGFSHVFGPIYEGGDTEHFEDPWDSSQSARSMPGNVRFRHSQRIVVEDCRFTRLGADGLEMSLGSEANVVRGNLFTDISGGGISIGARQPDTDLDRVNPDNVIENNLVYAIGVEYKGGIGIYAEKVQTTVIAHNEVHDVPYTGISFGEYWTHYPEGETTAHGNRILENHVYRCMQALSDGGGIFTAAHQGTSYDDGSQVRGNHVHDMACSPTPLYGQTGGLQLGEEEPDNSFGLYADDDANFVVWEGNVVYRIGGAPVSGCPLHNTFVGNFFEGITEPSFWCTRGDRYVRSERNVALSPDGDIERQCAELPAAAEVVHQAGLDPAFRYLANGG